MENKVKIFENRKIRTVWNEEKWCLAEAYVVEVLTDSKDVKQYIKEIRKRDE